MTSEVATMTATRTTPQIVLALAKGVEPIIFNPNWDFKDAKQIKELINAHVWHRAQVPTPDMLIEQHVKSKAYQLCEYAKLNGITRLNIFSSEVPKGIHATYENVWKTELAKPVEQACVVSLSTLLFLKIANNCKKVIGERGSVLCSHDAVHVTSMPSNSNSNIFFEKNILGLRPKLHLFHPTIIYVPTFITRKTTHILFMEGIC